MHPYYYPQQQYSGCLKVLLYIVSFTIPLAGLIVGLVFISRPDPESKRLGQTCMILAILSIVVWCCGSLILGAASGVLAGLLESM